jgi:hypothetical protein
MREIVSNPVSKAFDSQLLQSPMHSASTPGAFEDLQSSGFWAGDGQPAPYPSLAVRGVTEGLPTIHPGPRDFDPGPDWMSDSP